MQKLYSTYHSRCTSLVNQPMQPSWCVLEGVEGNFAYSTKGFDGDAIISDTYLVS